MGNALMDQLLKAGVVDKKKANRAKQQKRDQAKKGQSQQEAQARAREIEQQKKAKAQRDRELNLQRQKEQAEKEKWARVKQLIDTHKVNRQNGGREEAEVSYHFQHEDRIPSMQVNENLRQQLVKDQLRPVLWDEVYELIPTAIAERIEQEIPGLVAVSQERDLSSDEAKAYEAFPVPDDLIW